MSLVETWESEIRRDLAPFVDPGTMIILSRNGEVIEALWTQKRRERVAAFTIRGAEGVSVSFDGRDLSYRSFLALDEMGDVRGIAQTTKTLFRENIYVDTLAQTDSDPPVPAISLIQDLVEARDVSSGLTPFIMVTGEAGAGKTSLLKELVRRQAVNYCAGKADYVFLYINAQGRALSRFHEALATELNELRVSVPYHAIAVLARYGLVIPVVDGFDELLGAGGYDEAFASIWSFIQELDGKGAMVTSARSTYYEQEFLSRSERAVAEDRGGWQLESVALLGWSDSERSEFIEKYVAVNGGDATHITTEMNKAFAGERHSLSDKPLFVSRAIKVVASGGSISGPGSLISKLADEFIARELEEKLITKDGAPILSNEQMKALCADFAEEMWNLGTRELDRLTVSELAELAMSGETLAASEKATVISRMPNMAFLEPGESPGSVAFEHELFFDYFLSSRAAESVIRSSPNLTFMLGRAAMPESLAGSIAKIALEAGSTEVADCIFNLNNAANTFVANQELVRENCGRLIAEFLAVGSREGAPITGISLSNVHFPGSRLSNVVVDHANFNSVQFRRVDMRAAVFTESVAKDCYFESVLVDDRTVLDLAGVDPTSEVRGMRVADEDSLRTVFDPKEILSILRSVHLPAAKADDPELRRIDGEVIQVLEAYLKASARSNPLCVSENPFEFRPDKNLWNEVSKIGEDAGVFRIEFRQARGPKTPFVRRLFRSEDIMGGLIAGAAVPSEIARFWTVLESRFPAN